MVRLIDTGSMVISISKSFYDSMNPLPPLLDFKNFNLSLLFWVPLATNYHIKATWKLKYVPLFGNNKFVIPVLVVNNTEYNNTVPSIIGTNIIRLCK